MGEPGQKKTLKERLEGKKERILLWTTLLGLLSAEGIPAVVEALSDKPSTAQVQAMIAKKTEELTIAQRAGVDAIRELDKKISHLIDDSSTHRTVTGRIEGTVDLLRDVLRDCCTRRHVRGRLDKEPTATGMGAPAATVGTGHAVIHVEGPKSDKPGVEDLMDAMKKAVKKSPVEKLEKVPEFNMQQQLQIQMPEE
jgi:hypothetical protein